MLVIRSAQMDVFQRAAEDRFEENMVRHLGELFPARRGDPSLRGLIRAGIVKARAYGIETDGSIAVLIDLMAGVAPDFDERPEGAWARAILDDRALPDDARLDIIVEILQAREAAASAQEEA